MEGIPKARLRAFYIKPMLDPTYQWKDRETTDRRGFATLMIATNHSQWFFLDPTHGIFPNISVEAEGCLDKRVTVPNAFSIKPNRVQLWPFNPQSLKRVENHCHGHEASH